MDEDGKIDFIVLESEDKKRLDQVLASRDLGLSRSLLKKWILEGYVLVDGQKSLPKYRMKEGEVVEVFPQPLEPLQAEPEQIELDLVYEDEHLLVVNKKAGMVVHPAPGHWKGTLVNALLGYLGQLEVGDKERPGIVHRLDKDTSGLMIVAKKQEAHQLLVEMFKDHLVRRTYEAISLGWIQQKKTFESFHGRHPYQRKKFTAKLEKGKLAITHVDLLERLHGAALVKCQLETGRTHQIRVHLSEANHPILADPIYGRRLQDPQLKKAEQTLGRLALHAKELHFRHPILKTEMDFIVEPPLDFKAALNILREK